MRTAPAALLAAVLAAPAAAQPARVTIYAFDFDFSIHRPGEGPIEDAVINVGDVVVWVPLDEMHSTVACVGQAELWESPILPLTDTFEYQFTIPGVYTYYCGPHGQDNGDGTATGMWGTVTVLPAPAGLGVFALAAAGAWARRRVR